ncbi:MAG: UDP-N-acetylmuramate--L-alanine ligase [Candidatus Zambryskibacteria bacterium]|nr:UDP-N-acetylmuramate--L-alanine ligase [Candidatus Zambryskibacteria bacterium]
MEIDLEKIKKVHFVGIGGIGVSAIARLMHLSGKNVSGSDIAKSLITEKLRQFGIQINIGHKIENVPSDTDLVIHTIAVKEDNSEIMQARMKGIEIRTYPQMLAVISKNMTTIAVSGTHGKTTTTAMLSKILTDAELDPTVIVGSLMKDYDSNLIVGQSDYFIVEACEYRRSFLNLYPKILIITNIDEDHLDYYKDISDIQSAFRELALRMQDGLIVCDATDRRLKPVIQGLKCKVINYISHVDKNWKLKTPGEHNLQNAAACLAVADFLGLDKNKTIKSLESFSGTWRRFDLRGKTKNGTIIYDDYAHHPREIMATLAGMKEMYPDYRRIAFFQPHLFSRTKVLLDEFSESFYDADETYILPIYAAREGFDQTIDSQMLVEKIKEKNISAGYIENFEKALEKINEFDEKTAVIIMGAGNIYALSDLTLK